MSLPKGRTLDRHERLEIVLQVVEKNKPVSRVCKRAGISRSFFYELKKQYHKAGESRKEKLKALEPKREWLRRGRQLSRAQIKEILKIVLKNPEYGIPRILRQIYANRRKKIVSHGGIQTFLLKLNLNTKRKRRTFVKWARSLPRDEVIGLALFSLARYKAIEALSPEERLKALRSVDDGATIAYICRTFQISRKNFYKWQERYNQAPPGKEYQAVSDRKPIIERYWRQLADEQVGAILKIVVEHPEYSTHKIAEILPWVGNHGVQNVFRRQNLNIYEKRLTYSQTHAPVPVVTPITRVLDRIKPIFGKIPVISAIPPPLRYVQSKLLRFVQEKQILLTSFIFSFLTSVVFSTIFIYWLRMVSQAPTLGAKLGLLSATVALLVGSIFFAYSMKYYLTLAIVLSFSRQPLGEGGGLVVGLNGRLNNNQRNGNGWLARIFGLGNGALRGPTSQEVGPPTGVPAGGLQPSLEHIKLKRYPFVSIHLPFYNEKKVAERILKACTAMDYPPDPGSGQANYEIVVVDDSTDETTAIVKRFAERWNGTNRTDKTNRRGGPLVKVLHRPTRQGFKGGALACALEHMDPKAEFVVVFDADFIPYPDTLTLFIKYFQANGVDLSKQKFTSEVCRRRNTTSEVEGNKIAAVAGYQWHVLNKSENWITRGVRTEYAGSYVIERPGQEILGAMKLIHGSVYAIRADILRKFGWGTSITEDFELTLKLYEQGYKVVYTPYVQAPAECASTLKRLIRQRMRWAEGHSHCVKKMFFKLLSTPNMNLPEKLELLYLSPYYLQAFFFLVGTLSWLMAETVFRARLPFWTSLWGWSLVLTNFLSLPLVNAVGLFLEESEEKDYLGIFSFVFLSYILVPFQAYASVKGFLEKEEGPWFRTPKTGKITDIFTRGRFYRWISGIIPGRRPEPALARSFHRPRSSFGHLGGGTLPNPYLALATANNQFNNFLISRKRTRWIGRIFLVILLLFSTTLLSLAPSAPYFVEPKETQAKGFGMLAGPGSMDSPQMNLAKAGGEETRVTLEILNVYSHPKEGEKWVVNFKTVGKADLTITPMDQATVDDLDFMSLKCGEGEREAKVFDGPASSDEDTIFYPNWECDGESSLTHRVNKSGKHALKFKFGSQVVYAYNNPGNIFTNAPAILDFEENDLTDFDSTATAGTGVITASGTQKYSGSYSSHASITTGASGDRAFGIKAITAPANNKFYVRFFVYVDARGTVLDNYQGLVGALLRNGTFYCLVSPTGGNLRVWARDSGDLQYTTVYTPYNLDTWYEVEFLYDISGTNAQATLWVNGTEIGSWTGSGKGANIPNTSWFGVRAISWDATNWADLYIDDIQAASEKIGGTIDTSTSALATAYSFQRKTWYDGTRLWSAFYSGTEIEFWYSADWGAFWTQNTSATIAISTNDFTIEADNADAFIAYTDGYDIKANEDTGTYPATNFAWGATPTTVYDGSSTTDEYDYPAMTKDSNNKVWITATHLSGTDYLFKARQSTTANDISAWGTATTLDTSTNSNKYGTIVSLGSGNLYSVWIDGTAIEGSKYTGSWGSTDSVATGVTGLTNNMSAVSDSSGNVHLLYINSSDYAVYQEYTTSWQTAVTLDSTAGNDYPTISLNTSNNDLYALWIRSNVIYYKKGVSPYASANWDASATSWKSTGTNAYVTSNYSGAGMIFAQWTEGSASPYSVQWDYVIIPENLWLFLILSPFMGRVLKKLKKKKKQ